VLSTTLSCTCSHSRCRNRPRSHQSRPQVHDDSSMQERCDTTIMSINSLLLLVASAQSGSAEVVHRHGTCCAGVLVMTPSFIWVCFIWWKWQGPSRKLPWGSHSSHAAANTTAADFTHFPLNVYTSKLIPDTVITSPAPPPPHLQLVHQSKISLPTGPLTPLART
jgi:hypothetical protein